MTDIVETQNDTHTSRRLVLGAAAAIGAGAVLAACGGKDDTAGSSPTPDAMSANPTAASGPGTAAGAAADVPVGGAIVSDTAKVVVSQPKAGEFKAFDWTCTHKGCPVKKITGDTATCPCHGSQFSVLDGSVKKGPATQGLTPVKVVEKDGNLFVQG